MYSHGEGISLRKLCRSDLSVLYDLKQESWPWTHKTLVINEEDQEHWYQNRSDTELYMMAFHTIAGPVGIACYTDIDWLNRTCNISGSIFKKHRIETVVKASFAAGLDFAFEVLNMHRVGAEVLEQHVPAQKLEIDYLGFKVEGRRRQAVYKSGRYYDSLVLGILRSEWESSERVRGYGSTCNNNVNHDFNQKLISRASLGEQAL